MTQQRSSFHGTAEGLASHQPARDTVGAALVDVSKAFGATQALAQVSFELRFGEVLALVGENGAGKSTCVKVLGGVHQQDTGTVVIQGESIRLKDPLDSRRHGVAVVNQHPGLFGDLSIAENIFAGNPLRNRFGMVDHREMRDRAADYLALLGLHKDPASLVNELRISEQQMVEIARALSAESKILLLDEPTASLSGGEVDNLFRVIDDLRRQGVAMMFVGHRLEEIFAISDRLAVLRDGRSVGSMRTADTSQSELVKLMVGRELAAIYPERTPHVGSPVLDVSGLSAPVGLKDINLTVRAGEIVGLAGLVGAGRSELARVIFGVDKASSGTIKLDGQPVHFRSSTAALAHGVAYVSEDRRGQSIVEDFSILANATLPVIGKATKARLIYRQLELALVTSSLEKMRLKFRDFDQPISQLSGGNQQKVVLAKWLATNPRLLILDEPTQGIDVAAKAEVHRIVADLAGQGLAILLISSDLPEVLGMSDRVVVMKHGEIVAELAGAEATPEAVGMAATGASSPTPALRTDPAEPLAAAAHGGSETLPKVVPPQQNRVSTIMGQIIRRREFGLFAVLALLVVVTSITSNGGFLNATNLHSVSAEASLVAIAAIGQMLVILTRNIDVSVGSVIGLSAYLFGSWEAAFPNAPLIAGVAIALLVGLGCGVINGLCVAFGNVPSIVVTLGTLYIFRGIDSILSSGKQISPGDIPARVTDLLLLKPLGVDMLVWLAVVVVAVVGVFLTYTRPGRELYEVGSNPQGAQLLGIPNRRRVFSAFATSGLLAGLCGALWAMHYGIVDGQSAYGLELTVIAAVVVGGVVLRGGRGTVIGVALGTMVLFTINNALQLAKVDSNNLQAFYGAAIIVAVGLDILFSRRTSATKGVI